MWCRILSFLVVFSFCRTLIAGPIQTPKAKWIFQTHGSIRAAAVAGLENLYLGSSDGNLYCVRKSDGSLVWKFQTRVLSPLGPDRDIFPFGPGVLIRQ
jgi:outer membrane protein assembly factor BamB